MLTYGSDRIDGIRRRRAGRGWSYWRADGSRITDRAEIDRLNAIGLPPAYRDAWFSPDPNSHLQATGYDARGRKQYRYHPHFRARKDAEKFDRCLAFAHALPRLRARVERDLQRRGMPRNKAVAAVVRLLDITAIRVGNEAYAKANGSYGATTLRARHARLDGSSLSLRFAAKSGKQRRIALTDPLLARTIRRCQDLPGQQLFAYVDDAGHVQPVNSSDVNDYIRETMEADFTAKHFRTWGASTIAFETLCAADEPPPMNAILAPVTEALGNTPAIARKSYVHPALLDRAIFARHMPFAAIRATKYLSAAERGLIAFLQKVGRTSRKIKPATARNRPRPSAVVSRGG